MSHHALQLLCVAAVSLLVVTPASAQQLPCPSRGLGSAAKVIPRQQLASMPGRTALDILEHHLPGTFDAIGSALALRARGADATGSLVEPLLLLDGVAMEGSIAQVLEGLRAGDLNRIQVHLGTAATWRFRPGGAAAVIEITTLAGAPAAAVCLRPT